jgi:hypothetical protein
MNEFRSWLAALRPKNPRMKKLFWRVIISALTTMLPTTRAGAEPQPPLVLETMIPLPGVSGRIDHMTLDRGRQRLFVAALGNNSVEVIDLRAGEPVDRIAGLHEPQGVAYSDRADLVFVASAGDGSVRMFRGADLTPSGRIDLQDDADNIRIDPRTGHVVVGYGNGGLAIIDPVSRAETGTIKLQGHPEGFQIEPTTGRVFVNVPDAGQIAVVDLDARRQIAAWKVAGVSANFPMALDSEKGVLATVFRKPPSLVLLDTRAGAVKAKHPACADADDVFFDAKRARIYVSCGAGVISAFEQRGGGYYPLASVKTSSGARTSLFIPELDRLFLAERSGLLGSNAAIKVYRPAS